MHVRGSANTETEQKAVTGMKQFKIEAEGDLEEREDGFTDSQMKVQITGSGPGTTLTGNGEIILADKKTYYKIDEMPPIIANVEQMIGKWITASESTSEKSNFRANLLSTLGSSKEIFKDVKYIGREKVGADNTSKYSAILSPEGYSSFIEQLAAASGRILASDAKTQLQKNIETLSSTPVLVWIDSREYLRKILIVSKNIQTGAVTTVDLEFSNFGKPVKISSPPNPLPIVSKTIPSVSPSPTINLSPSPAASPSPTK